MHLICAQLQLFLLCPWNLNAWMRELKSNLHYQQRKANLLFQSVLWKGWPSTKKYILRLFFLGSWNPNKDIEAFLLSLSFRLRKKFEKIGLQQKQRSIYIHTYIMIIYWALLFEDRSSKSLSQWERHEEKGGYTSTYIYIAFHIHIHINVTRWHHDLKNVHNQRITPISVCYKAKKGGDVCFLNMLDSAYGL